MLKRSKLEASPNESIVKWTYSVAIRAWIGTP